MRIQWSSTRWPAKWSMTESACSSSSGWLLLGWIWKFGLCLCLPECKIQQSGTHFTYSRTFPIASPLTHHVQSNHVHWHTSEIQLRAEQQRDTFPRLSGVGGGPVQQAVQYRQQPSNHRQRYSLNKCMEITGVNILIDGGCGWTAAKFVWLLRFRLISMDGGSLVSSTLIFDAIVSRFRGHNCPSFNGPCDHLEFIEKVKKSQG